MSSGLQWSSPQVFHFHTYSLEPQHTRVSFFVKHQKIDVDTKNVTTEKIKLVLFFSSDLFLVAVLSLFVQKYDQISMASTKTRFKGEEIIWSWIFFVSMFNKVSFM